MAPAAGEAFNENHMHQILIVKIRRFIPVVKQQQPNKLTTHKYRSNNNGRSKTFS